MAKSSVEAVTEDKIAKGGVLARLYFDVQDTDKSKLQPMLTELISEHLLKERGVVYCTGTIEDPIEKNGIFITSASVMILLESFAPLINIAFRYAPAGCEILRPERELCLRTNQLQSLVLDVSEIATGYSKYMLEKVMDKDALEDFKKRLDNRAELGKRLMEKRGEGEGNGT